MAKDVGPISTNATANCGIFLDNLFPSPTHPRLPLCKLTCSTQKMKKSAASIPHNLAHAPQPPHGHTHTRTQEIQFTKKINAIDVIKEIHFSSHPSQLDSILYQLFIDTHMTHVHIPIHLILEEVIAWFISRFSHPR